MSSKVTYRLQFTRCGKQRCRKCREGAGHGPYWYAYWSENGRTISKYIGIRRPADIEMTKQQAEDSERPTPRQDASANKPVGERKAGLRIYLLGQFRVERRTGGEWQAVTNRTWQRRRARALLGCLLSNPGRRLGREQVMEALWPDLDVETAANRLNGAVHELRQILEPEITRPAASNMLRLQRDVLELADRNDIWVDVDFFESLLNQANTISNPEQIEQILEEAAALYGGDYLLEELYSEWATPRREALRRRWMGLLLHLAELRASRGALASAIEPLDRLLVTDPTHETAVRQLMLLLTQLDRRGEALQAYHRLSAVLQRDYNSDPLPETLELYEALRQGHIQAPRPKLLAAASSTPPPPSSTQAEKRDPAPHPPQARDGAGDTRESGTQPLPEAFPRPVFQSGRYNQSPLIGRDRELAAMQQVMAAFSGSVFAAPVSAHRGQEGTPGQIGQTARPAGEQNGNHGGIVSAHFLLLIGEAGIGKTRLAEELSHEASAHGWSVAWSRSYEQEGTIPYRPWTELLRILLQNVPAGLLLTSLKSQPAGLLAASTDEPGAVPNSISSDTAGSKLERLSALLPELRDLFPQLRSVPLLLPEQERLHLWEATLGLFGALGRTAPLLLVLDDLHWADESSLELLAYLARHLREQRVLLVATCRDIELISTHSLRTLINDLRREQAIVTLPVQPLTQSQIGLLVAHLPETVVQSIQTQAGGNPFFAEELARCVGTGGEETASALNHLPEPREQRVPLPETITAVLDRRLARLSNECQMLLGKAAVLGGPFEFSQLLYMDSGQSQSDNEEAVLDLLEEALRAGLLTEEGSGVHVTYHFWHPLIISHLYEHLSAARRTQLHLRAAKALLHLQQGREEEVAATVTYHLIRGGSGPEQIARYAEMAGNKAYSLAAYGEAEHYYRQAILAIAGSPVTLLSSRQHLSPAGTALPVPGNQDEEVLYRLTIAPETSAAPQLARLLEFVSECCMMLGNYVEARNLYERVLALRDQRQVRAGEAGSAEEQRQRQQEAQLQALIWREIGRTWSKTGDYPGAYRCFEQGKQVLGEAGVVSGRAWAGLQLQQGVMCCLEGNFEEARRWVHEALEMLEQGTQEQQDAKVGRSARNEELQTRTARALAGDPFDIGHAHELLGISAISLGQPVEALEHLHTALAIYEKHDLVMAMARVCGNLGAAYATKSDNAAARTYLRRSLELAERMGDLPNMGFVTGNLGEMAARAGDLLEAEEWFRRSLNLSERLNEREQMVWCSVALAKALIDQGRLGDALRSLKRAVVIGRSMKSARGITAALVARGNTRIIQAIIICKAQAGVHPVAAAYAQEAEQGQHSGACKQLLLRARNALQRALALEGAEVELTLEGRLTQANLCFMLGDVEGGQARAMQIMEEARQHELFRIHGIAQRLMGRILEAQGCQEQAESYFEGALDVFREYEMRLEYARTLYSYGATLLQREQPGEATQQKGLAYLREARDIFAHCHAAIDLAWANDIFTHAETRTREATATVIKGVL